MLYPNQYNLLMSAYMYEKVYHYCVQLRIVEMLFHVRKICIDFLLCDRTWIWAKADYPEQRCQPIAIEQNLRERNPNYLDIFSQ